MDSFSVQATLLKRVAGCRNPDAKGSMWACSGSGSRLTEPAFQIVKLPLADGGDGLLDIISYYTAAATPVILEAGPFIPDEISFLLALVKPTGRMKLLSKWQRRRGCLLQPIRTRTTAVDLCERAVDRRGDPIPGVEEIVIGIGGSATNDGGMGMAAALGVRFLDAAGKELSPSGGSLIQLAQIDRPRTAAWPGIRFRVASRS